LLERPVYVVHYRRMCWSTSLLSNSAELYRVELVKYGYHLL
jgi:hypothetical protein